MYLSGRMIAPLESVAIVIRERNSAPTPASFACAFLFAHHFTYFFIDLQPLNK